MHTSDRRDHPQPRPLPRPRHRGEPLRPHLPTPGHGAELRELRELRWLRETFHVWFDQHYCSGPAGDTAESDSLILNISDVSPIEISDQAMISNIISDSLNLNTTITSTNTTISSQGLKSTILNYFPSLKWMFVFID